MSIQTRIEKERKEAQEASISAAVEDIGWDHLAHAYRQLAEACDHKVEALQYLEEVTKSQNFSSNPIGTAIAEYLRQRPWPPKEM